MHTGLYCCVLLIGYCSYQELSSSPNPNKENRYGDKLKHICARLMEEKRAVDDLSCILRELKSLTLRAESNCTLSAEEIFSQVQFGKILPSLGIEIWLHRKAGAFGKDFSLGLMDTHMKQCNENMKEFRAAKSLIRDTIARMDAISQRLNELRVEYSNVQQAIPPATLNDSSAPEEHGGLHDPKNEIESFQRLEIEAMQKELGRCTQERKAFQDQIGELFGYLGETETFQGTFKKDTQVLFSKYSKMPGVFMESVGPVIVLLSQLNDYQKLESQKSATDWRRHSFAEARNLLKNIDASISSAEAPLSENGQSKMLQLKVLCDIFHSKSLDYGSVSGVIKAALKEAGRDVASIFIYIALFQSIWGNFKATRRDLEGTIRLLTFCRSFDWSGFDPHLPEEGHFLDQWHKVESTAKEQLERAQSILPRFLEAYKTFEYVEETSKELLADPEQSIMKLEKSMQGLAFTVQESQKERTNKISTECF